MKKYATQGRKEEEEYNPGFKQRIWVQSKKI